MNTPLDDVGAWLGRFVRTVQDSDLDLLTLWAAHTHLAFETYTSPRLLLDSPLPGSGKTTCLEHLHRLCVDAVQMAAISSPALLVRLLQDGDGGARIRTLLIDEVDRTLRPEAETTQDLLSILNTGYKRGGTRPVLSPVKGGGWVPLEMPTYSPVAMAGNSPNLPDDTRSRTVRVLLMPDAEGLAEDSDWERIEDEALEVGRSLAEWAEERRAFVAASRPELPAEIRGRFLEKWRPLARVAHAAGGRWPEVVARLALEDHAQVQADKEDGLMQEKPHLLLLRHIGAIWPEGEGFWSTTELTEALQGRFPENWGPSERYPKGLTTQRLGRFLAGSYKINSGRHPDDAARTRGYFWTDLRPVLAQLGMAPKKPDEPDEPAEPAEPLTGSTALTGLTGSKEAPAVCTVCREPLDSANVEDGFTSHPGCSPSLFDDVA